MRLAAPLGNCMTSKRPVGVGILTSVLAAADKYLESWLCNIVAGTRFRPGNCIDEGFHSARARTDSGTDVERRAGQQTES